MDGMGFHVCGNDELLLGYDEERVN